MFILYSYYKRKASVFSYALKQTFIILTIAPSAVRATHNTAVTSARNPLLSECSWDPVWLSGRYFVSWSRPITPVICPGSLDTKLTPGPEQGRYKKAGIPCAWNKAAPSQRWGYRTSLSELDCPNAVPSEHRNKRQEQCSWGKNLWAHADN